MIIELCCAYCLYKGNHKYHNILEISDEESLQKENISIESYSTELNEYDLKINSLKDNIEKEIEKINKLYEKTIEDLTKSFKEKHEKLIREENELKDKFQNETTKIKEQLEIYYSDSNNIIRNISKINKGIKALQNEEKNIVKNLNYISKINKTKKEIKNLLTQQMKNLDCVFQEDKTTIKYEEYYFNGIPEIKTIEFKDISSNSFNVAWKLNDINIRGIDKNQIQYKIEIRTKNKKFNKIYEGKDNNYLVNDLKKNKNYELRICSFYNDFMELWSDIKNCQTLDNKFIELNSNIIKNNESIDFVYKYLGKKNNTHKILSKLIYRASSDGDTANVYHQKCDGIPNTLCIIETKNNLIFGGFCSIKIICEDGGRNREDKNAFVFSINLKKIYLPKPDQPSIHCNPSYGPIFGNNNSGYLFLVDSGGNFFKKGGFSCNKNYCPYDGFEKDYEINGGNRNFDIKEIEVFQLTF